MDKESLVEAIKMQAARKGDRFLCGDCGCNVIHPHNSNFLLVFPVGATVVSVHGFTLAYSNIRALQTVINPKSIFNMTSLDEERVRDLPGSESIWDVLEECVESYNVVKDWEEGTQYCPDCARRRGLTE